MAKGSDQRELGKVIWLRERREQAHQKAHNERQQPEQGDGLGEGEARLATVLRFSGHADSAGARLWRRVFGVDLGGDGPVGIDG